MPDELAQRSALELAAAIGARRVSPVEVTRAVLARIDTHNPALNAYVTVHTDDPNPFAPGATRRST